jgi:septum formation protein
MQRQPLVLASQSAARAALLRDAGITFDARPARIDEAAVKAVAAAESWTADDLALTLAGMKSARIRAPGHVVVGADQVLVCEDRWFDKPADLDAARQQLLALRGCTHSLVTAVVCMKDGQEVWHHVATPVLTMRSFSDAFLDAYLALEGTRLQDSVGAYRLEGPGIQLFDKVAGEFSAILGLPLLPLMGFLRQHGVLTA